MQSEAEAYQFEVPSYLVFCAQYILLLFFVWKGEVAIVGFLPCFPAMVV